MRRCSVIIVGVLAVSLASSAGAGGRAPGSWRAQQRPDGALRVSITAPALDPVSYHEVEGTVCSVVTSRGLDVLKERDFPELPWLARRVMIPDGAEPVLKVTAVETEDLALAPPVPSMGFRSRSEPERPLHLGPFYTSADTYPREPVVLGPVRQAGGHRWAVLYVYPYRYDAATGRLLICRRAEVTISWQRPTSAAARRRDAMAHSRRPSREQGAILRGDALNPEAVRGTTPTTVTGTSTTGSSRSYTPLGETGRLLLVTPPELESGLTEFITWKRQRGLVVDVARYPADTGTGETNLASYLRTQAGTGDIDFVVLVGDAANIPHRINTNLNPDVPSDTLYTRVDTADFYHDFFISRLSAATASAVAQQAGRFITYEKAAWNGANADWLMRGTVIGSDQSNDSAFPKDKVVLAAERLDWLANGYISVDEIYDPGATATQVSTALNAGRSLLFYLGHGTLTQWTTSAFNTTTAGQLQNGLMLPFVVSGACTTGNFTASQDCLGEAFLKTTGGGAIGFLGATTEMDWAPPIPMEQGITDLVIAGNVKTLGGLTFGGVQAAMDWCYATTGQGSGAAEKIMTQTHLLGDCSLELRTQPPFDLFVSHSGNIGLGVPFDVHVAHQQDTQIPVANATVCLYAPTNPITQVVATTDSNGDAVLTLTTAAPEYTLTVYTRDAIPYQTQLGGVFSIVTAAQLPDGFTGEPYALDLTATAGTPPYRWTVTDGSALPEWLTLADSGALTGTPPTAGSWQFELSAADNSGLTLNRVFSLAVGTAVRFTQASPPDGMVNSPYSYTFAADGTFTPFTFSVTSGTLPPGLTFIPATATLSGTPSAATTAAFTVQVTDAKDRTASATCSVRVEPALQIIIGTPSPLPAADVGYSYQTPLAASGGSGTNFTWQVTSGNLPDWLTLSPQGTLSGTPTAAGHFAFTLEVADDSVPPHTATAEFTVDAYAPVYFTGTSLPDALANLPYSATVPVAGSYTPLTLAAQADGNQYSSATGSSSTFAETGTKQASWTGDEQEWPLALPFAFPFYQATYTSIRVGDNGYLVLGDNPGPSPMWEVGQAGLESHVMIAPFWSDMVFDSSVPETGVFVTTTSNEVTIRWCGQEFHTASWLLNFSVTLTASGAIRTAYGSITTNNRFAVGISNGAGSMVLTDLLEFDNYSPSYPMNTVWPNHRDVTFQPLTALPPGLTMASDGGISGTPLTAGTFSFTVTATDAHHFSASQLLTLKVIAWESVPVSLQPGWNCVSLPLEPVNADAQAVFPGHQPPAWHWDAAGRVLAPAATLHAKTGYWIYWPAATQKTFNVVGTQPVDTSLTLAAAWNLCGPAASTPIPRDGTIQTPVWQWWNGVYRTTSGNLEPGNAYWIYAPTPTVLPAP